MYTYQIFIADRDGNDISGTLEVTKAQDQGITNQLATDLHIVDIPGMVVER